MHEEVEHQRLKWAHDFQIQSAVDLDFVIGQGVALPIGMERKSPCSISLKACRGSVVVPYGSVAVQSGRIAPSLLIDVGSFASFNNASQSSGGLSFSSMDRNTA